MGNIIKLIGILSAKFLKVGFFKLDPRQSLEFAKRYFRGKKITVIEIGSAQGGHALQILKHLNVRRLYLIDPYKEYGDYLKSERNRTQGILNKDLEICKKRLSKYKGKVIYVRDFSDKAVDRVPNADYIYVDGNHEYEYVKKDLENYFPKVKNNGIFAGNDIERRGVCKAVVEFCYKNKLIPWIKHVDWWVIKKEPKNKNKKSEIGVGIKEA